jgi:hypothetical protein
MATLLPRKANGEMPVATDDQHHEQLAADPAINQFPQGSSFGSTMSSSSFGGSSGGFGSVGSVTPGNPTMGAPIAQQPSTVGQAAGAMHNGAESTVALDKSAEDWINKKWRPVMGWVYMGTCTCDFVIFPILWSLLQALSKGSVTSQWQPLTLQGAGLYHIAMGAVLGIAAYGRTKEKVEGKQ